MKTKKIGKNLIVEIVSEEVKKWMIKKHKQIKLVLDNENQTEEYANFAVATHSPAEFVIDFSEYFLE